MPNTTATSSATFGVQGVGLRVSSLSLASSLSPSLSQHESSAHHCGRNRAKRIAVSSGHSRRERGVGERLGESQDAEHDRHQQSHLYGIAFSLQDLVFEV